MGEICDESFVKYRRERFEREGGEAMVVLVVCGCDAS
jgi:hypothetical protein